MPFNFTGIKRFHIIKLCLQSLLFNIILLIGFKRNCISYGPTCQVFNSISESAKALWIYRFGACLLKALSTSHQFLPCRRESSHIGESSHLLRDLAKTSRHHCTPHISLSSTLKYSGIIPKSNTQSFLILGVLRLIERIYMLIDIQTDFHSSITNPTAMLNNKVNKCPPKISLSQICLHSKHTKFFENKYMRHLMN